MTALLAVLGVAALASALPVAARPQRATPAIAIAIWSASLVLRALVAAGVVALLIAWFPASAVFSALAHRCWHEVLPLLSTHVAIDGHAVGDAVSIVPGAALVLSLTAALVQLTRTNSKLRQRVAGLILGSGPNRSLLVADRRVMLAVMGFRRPRIVVSAGALTALDDDELEASLAHERGHIARRHRFVVLLGALCAAVARPLPGTRAAFSELLLHVERDADAYAVEHRHDPAALASAICKTALSAGTGTQLPALGLNGSHVTARVSELLAGGGPLLHRSAARRWHIALLLGLCITLTGVAGWVPQAVAGGPLGNAAPSHCEP